MAETILPARATNETVDRSMGDLWLAEMAYRRAAGKVNLSELHHLVQDITTSHTMRQVNVWKTTEKRAFQEPADIFGQLEELHTNVLNELALADVPTEDADARMQQIAEFHGTTTLPDVVVPSTGVDVDTYLGCDTDDEDELVETESSNPSSSEADDRGAIVLDKTSKGYSQFMEKYLFTASVRSLEDNVDVSLNFYCSKSSWRVTLFNSVRSPVISPEKKHLRLAPPF